MQIVVYTWEECGFQIYQEVTVRVFMSLFECLYSRCKTNRAKGNLNLQLRASKVLKFQEAKILELAEHVPESQIPLTLTVHPGGELTRKAAPGDVVEFSGMFVPIPDTNEDTYVEAALAQFLGLGDDMVVFDDLLKFFNIDEFLVGGVFV